MRLRIRGKNLIVTQSLASYAESKLVTPIQKLLKKEVQELPLLEIELSRTTSHHRKGNVFRAEANLSLGRKLIRAEAEAEDVRQACDLLEQEIKREVTAFKSKRDALVKRSARAIKHELWFDPAAQLNTKGRPKNEGN